MANNQVQLKDRDNNKCYPNPYWPVGSIFLSMNNTNPSVYFGGTWQLIGQGRTLVGVNTSDSALNTSNKTGGSTNPLTSHNHTQNAHDHWVGDYRPSGFVNAIGWYGSGGGAALPFHGGTGASNSDLGTYGMRTDQRTPGINNNGDNTNHNNWQPFLTCYIWNRIS